MANRHHSTSSSSSLVATIKSKSSKSSIMTTRRFSSLSTFERCQYSFWNKICQTFTNLNKKTITTPLSGSNDLIFDRLNDNVNNNSNNNNNYDNSNNSNMKQLNGQLKKQLITKKQPFLSIKKIGALASMNHYHSNNYDNDDDFFSGCPVIINITARNGVEIKTVKASVGKRNQYYTKDISYTNEKMIGNGSFGVVYQATLLEENEVVAIKRVLQDRRFKNRELSIMVSLDHCNIVKLKYFFYTHRNQQREDIYLNLVLEFIPDTVSKVARYYMRQGTKIPMNMIKLYMYQLFRALAYIHSLGICHRDIKPQNLLVNPMTGVLKLCDFGSAKHLVRGEMNVSYICSRYYRAPELIFGATDYTTKIDIWSAGCVFAELLLGYPIFSGESGVDQLVEIIKILGTPSKDQIRRMNRNYTEFKFPKITPNPWDRVFGARTPPEVIDLISKLLDYTPFLRLDPLKCCTHRFFDELRVPNYRLPQDREPPPLFNFTEQELKIAPELNAILIPQHLHSQFSEYIIDNTNNRDLIDSTTNDPAPSTSTSVAKGSVSNVNEAVSNTSQSAELKASTSSVGSTTSGNATVGGGSGNGNVPHQSQMATSPSSNSVSSNPRFSLSSPKQQQMTNETSLKNDADESTVSSSTSNIQTISGDNNNSINLTDISNDSVTTTTTATTSTPAAATVKIE